MQNRKNDRQYNFLNGQGNVKLAIFATIFYSIFLILGIAAIIFAFISDAFLTSFFAGLLFILGGGLMFVYFALYEIKRVIKQKSVTKSGKMAIAKISDYSCKRAKIRPKQIYPYKTYYTVRFNFTYTNLDGIEVTCKYVDTFTPKPNFANGKTFPVVYNRRYALLLKNSD